MQTDYAVETEHLSKSYRDPLTGSDIRAVDDVSLRVPRGVTFGLLGPNGAGKTTCVKMLLSAVRPSSGVVRVFGIDTRRPQARRAIGFLPENHRFPTYMTGSGMLDFYAALSGMRARERRRRIPELLERLGLASAANTTLNKYSKGMLQRVGLAQALMHSPDLLILDEPTDGVDPVGRREIRDMLRDLERQGVTIFLNSHLLAEVELFCREVAIIHRGRLILQGRVNELTSGAGYQVAAEAVPDALQQALSQRCSTTPDPPLTRFTFETRDAANQAIDELRAAGCPVESVGRQRSTLEDVFLKAVRNE